MTNIINLTITILLLTLSCVANAVETKQLDTQFSIYEIVKNYYSFDICVPKKQGITPAITITYWDGTKNILSVHPESREFDETWQHSNIQFQAYDKTKRITVSVDFNTKSGVKVKSESFSLLNVTKDFKNRALIVPEGQTYVACSKPENSTFGEVFTFKKE